MNALIFPCGYREHNGRGNGLWMFLEAFHICSVDMNLKYMLDMEDSAIIASILGIIS